MWSFRDEAYNIYRYMKDDGYFPRPVRNRPDLARKKEQGRNEQCACGSGKKYKYCCGK